MPFADVNGQHIYYEDSGGDGPAVIFSHGFLMDHEMFAPQVADLAPEFRCITWDERGFGQTPATAPFTYYDSAADCLALLSSLGVERAVLAGMSQGGFLSLRAALAEPERVAALVLIDTQAGVEDPEAVPLYEGMHDTFISVGPEPVQEAIASLILGADADWAPWFAKWATLDRAGFTHAFRCLMDRDDISDRIGTITCPAIIFHGSVDVSIPMPAAEYLRDHLGGSTELVTVEGAAHASNLTHAGAVDPPLREFLHQHG
jgi:pimeloyl-ACP methyl ester carboxylesterase